MANARFNVLFLCARNSARSIMAEGLLNHFGGDHFVAYSAGSNPAGQIHPIALDILRQDRIPTESLRSKSWDEFAVAGAPSMDFIITLCDEAAGEVCPVWPGQPISAHWGTVDPATAEGTDAERRRAFFATFTEISQRIRIFASLPMRSLDRIKQQEHLDSIGRSSETAEFA